MSFYDLQYFNIYSIMLVLICETKFFGLIFFVKLSSSQQIQPNWVSHIMDITTYTQDSIELGWNVSSKVNMVFMWFVNKSRGDWGDWGGWGWLGMAGMMKQFRVVKTDW